MWKTFKVPCLGFTFFWRFLFPLHSFSLCANSEIIFHFPCWISGLDNMHVVVRSRKTHKRPYWSAISILLVLLNDSIRVKEEKCIVCIRWRWRNDSTRWFGLGRMVERQKRNRKHWWQNILRCLLLSIAHWHIYHWIYVHHNWRISNPKQVSILNGLFRKRMNIMNIKSTLNSMSK